MTWYTHPRWTTCALSYNTYHCPVNQLVDNGRSMSQWEMWGIWFRVRVCLRLFKVVNFMWYYILFCADPWLLLDAYTHSGKLPTHPTPCLVVRASARGAGGRGSVSVKTMRCALFRLALGTNDFRNDWPARSQYNGPILFCSPVAELCFWLGTPKLPGVDRSAQARRSGPNLLSTPTHTSTAWPPTPHPNRTVCCPLYQENLTTVILLFL